MTQAILAHACCCSRYGSRLCAVCVLVCVTLISLLFSLPLTSFSSLPCSSEGVWRLESLHTGRVVLKLCSLTQDRHCPRQGNETLEERCASSRQEHVWQVQRVLWHTGISCWTMTLQLVPKLELTLLSELCAPFVRHFCYCPSSHSPHMYAWAAVACARRWRWCAFGGVERLQSSTSM